MAPRETKGELADLLTVLGVDRAQARILAHLATEGEGKSADLERSCRLRQPQVSLATKDLRTAGWVTVEERKSGGRGRPVHVYRLERPLTALVDALEDEKRREITGELDTIQRLRRIVG
ncbi:MAG TPA: MarR family transcriptional regulator [Candidatus Thermoplasmatota archaeon]|nr:MarR family transcriptional regulator [Candidatus Thermoplasmatota archaeon]